MNKPNFTQDELREEIAKFRGDHVGAESLSVHLFSFISGKHTSHTESSIDERAEFEAWVSGRTVVKKYGAKLNKNSDGSYGDYRINDRWLAWSARANIKKG